MDRECSEVIRRLSVLPDVTLLDSGGMLESHGLNHNAMIWGDCSEVLFSWVYKPWTLGSGRVISAQVFQFLIICRRLAICYPLLLASLHL